MPSLPKSDNCHNLEKFARDSAKQWIRDSKRSGHPFDEYVEAIRKNRDRHLLEELSTGSQRFKGDAGQKLSPFQRQFIQIAASQKLSRKKT